MRYNKKAALELSITAIVVLIIAITLLALGIGFIKKQFGAGTELVGEQFGVIKEQLSQEFLSKGMQVGFSEGKEIEVDSGTKKELYVGMRNTESVDRCYLVDVVCNTPFSRESFSCGGIEIGDSAVTSDNKWFTSFPKAVLIGGNDIYVAKVDLHITDAIKDTYRMKLNLYKAEDCDSIFADESMLIDSQYMHIIVR